MKNSCELCERVSTQGRQASGLLIHEFPSSLLFLGEHQYFEGYSVLVLKAHASELHAMAPQDYAQLMSELFQASGALAQAFRPWKLNHASLGNVVPHLHWHLFPRYADDPDRLQQPWLRSAEFAKHVPDPQRRDALIARIRAQLPS